MNRPQVATVGADVEGFLYSTEKNIYVPCVGILPGTKEHPHPIEGLPKGFCTQEDNVMVEWNIPPATTAQKFSNNVKIVRKSVDALLKERKLRVVYQDTVFFEPKDLQSEQAKTFGCDPDFDAYQGGEMRGPPKGLMEGMRGAGGHIHIGGDFQCPDFVAALFCDMVLGVGVGLGYGASARNEWYGKPGIFRPKPYGIEYRTPSAIWAESTETTAMVSSKALKLSKWLSETDASTIQRAFTGIDWRRVHNWMSHAPSDVNRSRERTHLIRMAQTNGVPM